MISSTVINIRDLRSETSAAIAEAMGLNSQLEQVQWKLDRALSLTTPKDLIQEGIKLYHEDRSYRAYCNEYGSGSDWREEVCSEITYLIREYREEQDLPRHIRIRLLRIENDIDCMSFDQYEATLAWLREGLYMPFCDLYKGM